MSNSYFLSRSLFCDTYMVQQGTYCKRLKVICPEHYKERKVGRIRTILERMCFLSTATKCIDSTVILCSFKLWFLRPELEHLYQPYSQRLCFSLLTRHRFQNKYFYEAMIIYRSIVITTSLQCLCHYSVITNVTSVT